MPILSGGQKIGIRPPKLQLLSGRRFPFFYMRGFIKAVKGACLSGIGAISGWNSG